MPTNSRFVEGTPFLITPYRYQKNHVGVVVVSSRLTSGTAPQRYYERRLRRGTGGVGAVR